MGQSISVNLGPQPLNFGAQWQAFTNQAALKTWRHDESYDMDFPVCLHHSG